MFEAIRSKCVGAWSALRSRGLVTLFFFELVVVTLGILLAQGLADWESDRSANRDMEAARLRAFREIGGAAYNVRWWSDVSPCLENHMRDVLRAASGDGAIAPDRQERPSIGAIAMTDIDAATLRRLADRHGAVEADEIQKAARQVARIQERREGIADAWQAFVRLDPRNGAISASDRDAARASAAQILALLRGLEINGHYLLVGAERLRVPVRSTEDGRPVRNCAEMWSTGSTFLRPEDVARRGEVAR